VRIAGSIVAAGIAVSEEALGLSGRADAVEIDGAAVRPVEYKSGGFCAGAAPRRTRHHSPDPDAAAEIRVAGGAQRPPVCGMSAPPSLPA